MTQHRPWYLEAFPEIASVAVLAIIVIVGHVIKDHNTLFIITPGPGPNVPGPYSTDESSEIILVTAMISSLVVIIANHLSLFWKQVRSVHWLRILWTSLLSLGLGVAGFYVGFNFVYNVEGPIGLLGLVYFPAALALVLFMTTWSLMYRRQLMRRQAS